MPNILTEGKTFHPQLSALPAQQEQNTSDDVFGMLDQLHGQRLQKVDTDYNTAYEGLVSQTRYKLKTLENKYNVERGYIENFDLTPMQKQQKLQDLNMKYQLAITTANGKITPDIDFLKNQKEQALRELEQDRTIKRIKLRQIQDSFEKGNIVDPAAALKEQYEVLGYNYPLSAFRQEQADPMEQIKDINAAINNIEDELQHYTEEDIKWGPSRGKDLVRYPQATTTGLYGEPRYATEEEKETYDRLLITLDDLITTRNNLMAEQLPEYANAFKKSNRLSKVGLQMTAGRKPGTLAEGVWQKKQKQLKSNLTKMSIFGLPGKVATVALLKSQAKKLEQMQKQRQTKTITSKNERYATNPNTGQTLVSRDDGQTWEPLNQ